MAFLRPTLLQALVLCLAVWLNTALATDLVLTTGSNSLAPTPVSTGDTLTVTCPVGPCTVTAASGGIFAVENGASLVMNGFTLVQTGATDAITLAGNASLTMSGVTFGDGTSSGNAAVVKAVADSTPTITVTNSTVTGRAGAGGSVFWFQGAGNSALTIDGLIFTGNTDATLVKGTAMTDLLTASITNSYFYSSAASGTAASLFDADESNVALTVDGNYLDGINSRIIQIKETNNPANTFTLSMSGNTITKSALSTASTHLISIIKVTGTATLTNNLFQSNTVGGTSAIIYFNQNPATTSLTAENNQFISNTAPFGNIHVSSAVVTVVLRDHTVQTCACTSGAGIYFLAATGSSFLLERGTITENAHGSGTAGLIAVSTSNLASYVIRDSYFYYNRLSSISGNAMLTFSSTTMIDALIENSEFDTIQGRTAGAVLTIGSANTGTVTIRDSYFHDCSATNGALKIGSTSTVNVNIDNCTFSNNLATFDSPGVTSDNSHNGVIAIENSIFRDNTGGSGGAIDHRTSGQGKMIIRNCVFERNTATVMGGAIHVLNNQYPITLEDCAFYHNTAPKGGVWASEQGTKGYPLGIGNVTFFENSATEEGGVFYLLEVNTNYEFQNMNFIRNTAAVGGAIFMDENPYNVTIDACTFDSNSATEMAGAVYLGGTNPSITNSVFTSNEAPLGSSVLLANSGDISLQELEFTNGESNHGSLYLNGGVGLSASELTFTENVGSAIYATGTFSGPLSFAALHVTQNVDTDSVSGVGDCIVNFDTFTGDVTISNSEFADNEVSVGSIIKFSGTGGVTVTDCEFTSNTGAIFYGDEATNSAFEDCDFASNSALAAPDQELMSMFRVLDSSSLSIEGSLVSGAHYDHLLDVKSFEPVSISHSDFFIDSFEDSLFNIDSTQVTMNTVNIQVAPSETLGTCFVLDKTASLTMIDITISGCQSTKAPALLFASGKSVIDISGSTIENITETDSSAFQVTENSHLTLSDSTFKNVVGGLFFISGSGAKATISDTTVSEGETSSSEASFFHINRGAQVNMTNVSVSKGNSLSSGGCVTVDSGSLDWVGGSISQCTSATQGAAISFSGKVNAQLSGITFDGNVAFQGGAISVSQLFSSSVVIQECDFTNNEAESAGVLYIAAPTGNTFVFEDCTFDSNIASELGGVMMGLDFAAVDFVDCTITNNQAKQGGMGFLDWNSRVTITSSTAENNVASESGGLFFMDKSSELTLTESTVTGSQAQTGSGGAVYMTQTAEITVVDTDFVQCAAAIDGGAISSPFGSKCAATISDSSFTLCHADVQGGAISFSQFSSSSFVLGGNTFSNNTADLGGALSNLNAVFTPNVTGNVFEHNEAATYGNDIYSPPAALTTTATSFSLLSGKSAPTIKVTLRDNYGNEYDQLPPQFFFVFASVEAISNVTKPGYLSGTTSLQITNGHVSFTGLEIFGYPGNYRLRLGPSVGNTFYTGPTYVTYVNFEINNCLESEGNHQDDDDLSCDAILCSGCPVEKGATCVSPGNCSCPATYEGLQCEFVRDSYDSITLRFPTLPMLPSGHSNEEITVEMRDFILSELAKAYAKFEGVVVKFRSFTMGTSSRRAETATFDFKYSLLLSNLPIEGEDLELYNDEATTYFSEEHGIGGLSSNLVNSEAIIMTYSDPVVIAVVIITAIMLAVTVALGIISLVKKDTPVIRSSSPIFCLLILIGVVLAYVTPFSYIGPQSTLSCAAPVVLGPMAFSIVFGNLLAKTFRIYRIFANRTMRASSPTLFQLLGVSGAILGLEMLFVIIWLAIDPPVPVRMGPEGARYWTCASPLGSIMIPIIVAYDGVLLLFGVFLAFKTRNAYSAYKETQLIGFTIYSLSIVAIAILPVLYLIELPLETQFAIRSFSILFVASVTMFLLFGNKVIVILFLPEQNTTEYFNNKNGSSSLKGGFVLKPMGSRTQTMSTTGFDINDVKMSSQGWMMILESKPWSQWKNMYAVQTGEYFGFFENEDCSGHRGGLHPISQWVVERIQTEGRLQMKLTLGDHSCIAETPNPDDMEKWFNSLVKVAHVNL